MYIYKAKCERVVDGDTIDATIDLGFDTWKKIRIRLVGINAAESRTIDLEEKSR
jgi:micrococcal nuclease